MTRKTRICGEQKSEHWLRQGHCWYMDVSVTAPLSHISTDLILLWLELECPLGNSTKTERQMSGVVFVVSTPLGGLLSAV